MLPPQKRTQKKLLKEEQKSVLENVGGSHLYVNGQLQLVGLANTHDGSNTPKKQLNHHLQTCC